MALVIKRIKGREYYYLFLSYFLVGRSKSFSRYVGIKRPAQKELSRMEDDFRSSIMLALSGKNYAPEMVGKDEVIRALLFRDLFYKRYRKLTEPRRRKYDIDSTVLFTLTTLTTEDVDVSLSDVRNALGGGYHLTQRERISRNMLNSVESIKKPHKLDKDYLLWLHKTAMASFETKSPGHLRDRQVYLYKAGAASPVETEIAYRPPHHSKIDELLDEFIEWYKSSRLDPLEKATMAHYRLYRIHPFLDGNKRVCRLLFNKTLIDGGFPMLNVSMDKEGYFEALIESAERNRAKILVDFVFKQYYRQVRDFLIRFG